MYNAASAVFCRSLAVVRSLPLPGCGLGGDSITDRRNFSILKYPIREYGQTDGRTEAITISPLLFLKSMEIMMTECLSQIDGFIV